MIARAGCLLFGPNLNEITFCINVSVCQRLLDLAEFVLNSFFVGLEFARTHIVQQVLVATFHKEQGPFDCIPTEPTWRHAVTPFGY